MKKLFTAFNIIFMLASLTCISCETGSNKQGEKAPPTISKIKIIDRTSLHYYMNGRTISEKIITDPGEIKRFQVELDSMKGVENMNIRHSLGFYELILFYNNGKQEDTGLIYTIFDGIVFYNYNTNKAFKNNNMEGLVESYFKNNN